MTSAPGQARPAVGQMAPAFSLPSLRGSVVDLASYRGRRNVVVWFSRGFTCPFCRVYTDGMRTGYAALRAADTEIIQVAPNLLDSARRFFAQAPLPFPFVCDPDKRLYAVYGLGDVGALEATKTAVVSFAHAFTHGDTNNQIRGAWFDVMNRNFVRRLHHHAMTAQEQGMFLIDKEGIIRSVTVVGPIDPMPGGADLAAMARAHCPTAPVSA
ncbi:MAG TPA: peroxiredoxin-like family protein [Candidatus Acidoferrum sp.]|jgi:peroxiredoxin|nr:peroxiredoxin-like family protein [Candidatus Acidoferrum sp.]